MKIAFTAIPKDFDVVDFLLRKHQRLFDQGLHELHFDMVAGHLIAVLEELEVEQGLIALAVSTVGPLRVVFEKGAALAEKTKKQRRSNNMAIRRRRLALVTHIKSNPCLILPDVENMSWWQVTSLDADW